MEEFQKKFCFVERGKRIILNSLRNLTDYDMKININIFLNNFFTKKSIKIQIITFHFTLIFNTKTLL